MGKHDEDSDDKLLDQAGAFVGKYGNLCRAWYTNRKGKRVRCTRKKGHWGGCK